ncbi:MAG: serine/threonine protein kinase, partial [Bryobacteraceae bacterium]|nr:serine/threonine protein kinase [Bryobacteraceae bacterium]
GGMGVVYSAYDPRLGREVALKVVDAAETAEARLAASLEHPGIVTIHDTGLLPDGRAFYVMRLLPGHPLDLFIQPDTPLSIRIAIFQKICDAVSFAHSKGVIHRDLKPANVMAGEFGEISILDWGIARAASEKEAARAGTPRFMAPEQAAGAPPAPRADIFSLGALLSFLLPADAPKPLRAIAAKASAANPQDRYASVSEISAELGRFLDGFPVEAYRENPIERAARFIRREKLLLLLIGAYFLTRMVVYFISGR